MKAKYILFYVILIALLYNYSQTLCQTNPNFNFNNESIQGWSLNLINDYNQPIYNSFFVGPEWSDNTNYPNPILKDPTGDVNGSLSFSCIEGTGIEDTATFWIMQFVSPDLSASPDWQVAKGYSVQLLDDMSQPGYSTTIWANLYVQVFDKDAGSVRYFYNGTAQPLIKGEWNYFSFDWSAIGTFPKNYTIQDIFINIWGTIAGFYAGAVYLDEVNLIPGANLQIVKPNGGENWQVGNNYDIQWYSNGISTVNLDYTTDNGSSWNSIASNVAAAAGNYLWTIPNTPSNNCFVRIYGGILDVEFVDESDSAFTISPAPTITVTIPNGGENWIIGSQKNIAWSSTDVGYVNLEFSTNNGETWSAIASNVPAVNVRYLWTIPNTPSSECLIKVSDALNPLLYDESDGIFTISTIPTITVNSPNGGENWLEGTTQKITWFSDPSIFYVKIEYSTNGGNNWITITDLVQAVLGNYSWIIPNTFSTQCLVKVSDASNPGTFDVSNSVFTISPSQTISLTTPNGGENWLVGSIYDITWTSNNITNIKIEYSTNNGSNWINIVQSISNNNAYRWTVPNTPSTNCIVRVSDATNASVNDQSNSVFTISSLPAITIISPNGGENWVVGSSHNIIWTSASVSNVKIEYSTDSGSNWLTIVSNTPSASSRIYVWSDIPNTPSAQCLVRISDILNPQTYDVSNNPFTINASIPQIEVTSPNGGDIWTVGNSYNITWTSIDLANVKIEYTTDSGNNWINIISSTLASSGIFNWVVPNTPSSSCKIKVSDAANADVFAESDIFTISPPSPVVTFSVDMSFVSPPISSNDIVAVRGSIPPLNWGQNFNLLKSAGSNIYNGTVEFESSYNNNDLQYKFVIQRSDGSLTWESNAGSGDQGNRVYNLKSGENVLPTVYFNNLPLLLTSPNGGETLFSGTTFNITWESARITNLNIEYSVDGGNNWITIISNIPANTKSYNWTVPYSPSSQCLIRLSDTSNPTMYDLSDSAFTIKVSEPLITVISPKVGDKWIVGNSYTIQWDQNIQEVINLELYKGNSLSVVIAAPVYAINAPYGTFDWTVPLDLPVGNDYRVKIISSLNDSVFAFSNFFSIIHQVPIADFSASPVKGLRPLNVNFSDLSVGEITGWLWNFGDGSTSSEQNPVHTYKESGLFNVVLTVTGSGGNNSITMENYITVDSLRWNLPSNTKIGENVFISTTVPDYFKPTIHKLFYRMGGKTAFIETDFQMFNDSLDAVIPQDFITLRGIEYYILLSDGEKIYTFPETDPQNHPAIISVSLQNIMPTVSFQSKKYDMISIPLNLAGNNAINFLINAYGQYDKNNWRLFRWDNSSSSYLEYPDLNVDLTPGIAFWLITRDGKNFSISDAKSINTSKDLMIDLTPGWNQIGNPFPFPVAWDSIKNSGLVQSPVYWNSETQQYESSPILWNTETDKYEGNQKSLMPWRGYFVYNQTESEVILGVPPVESTGLDKNIGVYHFKNDEFIIQIKCYGKSNNNDYQNYVGMLNNANDGIDKFDVFEPPSISDKLNLTIIKDNKDFIQNIVPVSPEGAYWDLGITSNQPDKTVRIEFEKKSSLPDNFKIWFLDKNRMLSLPVSDNGMEIRLPENGKGKFRLIIGKEEYALQNSEQIPLVPVEYTLFQNYPNPFNSMTNIMYNLREKSQVRVEVFDILGRRVKVLINSEIQNPGIHNLLWDGKNTNGNYTASGVYIYRINANDFSDSKMMVLLK